ncbi:uncharacterized protein LOC110694316 isoform X1 [Chenopodium quinoa]|uniref:uncharacterized protein LOC110694316 isoform X1 n=1 Tax=Chenopodium quinoa TaxID=63459 RepID=UPI000B79A1C1|nr:uncharacterized protein LOC110694316 isoform X1 [Chenopodium quinoa]
MTTISKRKRSSIGGATASEDQPPKIEKPMFLDNGQKVIQLHAGLFKENSISVGGLVKERSAVLMEHSASSCRPPNMNCRIESFGRICQKFDDRRRRWVYEMGFGGLLHFACNMHLPRQLAYWLMTRVDPLNKVFIAPGGREYRLSKNQVRWVLGIPNGSKEVPTMNSMSDEVRDKVQKIFLKYGKSWETKSKNECGNVYTSIRIPVTSEMKDRLEGHF